MDVYNLGILATLAGYLCHLFLRIIVERNIK